MLKFLFGNRIYSAIKEEWNVGNKFLAAAVVFSCFSGVLTALAYLTALRVYG